MAASSITWRCCSTRFRLGPLLQEEVSEASDHYERTSASADAAIGNMKAYTEKMVKHKTVMQRGTLMELVRKPSMMACLRTTLTGLSSSWRQRVGGHREVALCPQRHQEVWRQPR